MSTASVIISIIAMILIFGFGVTITVLVSRSLSRAFSTVDSMHMRSSQHIDSILDRLMTVRWEDFAALRSTQEAGSDDGGFFPPGSEDEEETGTNLRPLALTLSDRFTPTDDEQDLLNEDFETDEERRIRQAREHGVV